LEPAIVAVVLEKRNPLSSKELLFQVTSDGLLLLASEGGDMLASPCLVRGLACSSHDSDESLLLSVHGVVLLRLGDGGLLPVDGGEIRVAA
jgi:hypothetical protein